MKEVNFLMSNWGNSHQINRFLEIEKLGYSCNIYVFERFIYKSRIKRNYISLGKITPGHYKNRIFTYLKAYFKLNKILKERSYFYVFGLDIILLIYFVLLFNGKNKNIKIIYEVPDIRPIQYGSSIKSSIVRFLEKKSFKKIELLIVTSESYYTEFYKKSHNYPKVNFFEFENKIHDLPQIHDNILLKPKKQYLLKNKLVIGYFGMIRDPYSIEFLIKLSKTNKYFIIIRGVLMNNCQKYLNQINKCDNIFFGGSYFSPDNLFEIYSEIDISWVVYTYSSNKTGNWKWAKTNRFYEAGYYKKPMITLRGTKDASLVSNLNLGIEIDLSNFDIALNQLIKINRNMLLQWENNFNKVPIDKFIYTNEYEILNTYLKRIYNE